MADERRPVDGPSCADVQESVELLALDALDPAERDALRAHLDACPACRAELAAAEDVLGSVLLLAPHAEVPSGFVERAVGPAAGTGTFGGAAAGEDHDAVGHRDGRGALSGPRPTRWVALAAACVVIALLLTGLGVALGTVFASDGQVAAPPVTVAPSARTAPLLTADGAVAGSVVVDDAGPTLVMAVESVVPGVPYDCVVRSASGELVTVGSWTPSSSGGARWQVPLDPALGSVDEVLLTGPGGVTLATARPA